MISGRCPERALFVKTWKHHRIVVHPDIPCNKRSDDDLEADEKTDYFATILRVGVASVLQRQDQANDAPHAERNADNIRM